jgi:hypothetical protein
LVIVIALNITPKRYEQSATILWRSMSWLCAGGL